MIRKIKSQEPAKSRRSGPQSKRRRQYTLDDLLKQCDPNAPLDRDEEWLSAPPVGGELI